MTGPSTDLRARNRRTAIRLTLAVFVMFGFGFALVPLYDVFCYVTGINGKTQSTAASAPGMMADESRSVVIELITNIGPELPWEFHAEQFRITVRPGALTEAVFTVQNRSTSVVAAQAIPSVAPGLAARFLVKTECFCFAKQTLQPGEIRRMPVRFFVDPRLPESVPVMTLSYTFFALPEQVASLYRATEPKEPGL